MIVVDEARSDEEAEERENTWRKAETSCELIKIHQLKSLKYSLLSI